ncbi:J domain-containing protein DDB_G0295729 isoform X2 [Microplitis mediator]|uniref:J domain-containing protein DDB_G0295729 isoform X2 n=1 Tax=Microplitis mediator TaxID=375433 RepID=UPI00255757FE|nr:J domain-containing protein DDB_G0295729 isoform X2 [Microplitis mediator]
MPSSQNAATERRNDRMISHEPPKLKTTLKTSPKQATNPLQFVKVGPCSLYRTAQEQLQKVQEVKKVKQEVRDDPEDWQSNLDNWKSSRRKRQEHIIERVVEVKKLELEEHDRHRRRSKTFSEMMEERSSRGRKLSMSLALYHEEDSNDLSDLGIGTSSGKSSVSGDTHDDTQSVLSDRDSEIDKNHSDLDNTSHENGNTNDNNNINPVTNSVSVTPITKMAISKKSCSFGNGFQDDQREYDSGTTATTSSPEPDEYNYEGAIRYNRAPPQTLPRTSLIKHESKLDNKSMMYEEGIAASDKSIPVVKVDVLKRREIFEKAAQKTADNKVNNNASNRSSGDFSSAVSIKERLLSLEKQTVETGDEEEKNTKVIDRLSGDMTTIRERLSCLEKQVSVRENKISRKLSSDEFEPVRPLRERLSTLEKYASSDDYSSVPPLPPVKPQPSPRQHVEFTTKVKDRLSVLDSSRSNNNNNINNNNNNNNNNINNNKDVDKKPVDKQILRFNNREIINETSPSERSSSPDSEYRAPRATFHQSLDSLDADASSEPDTFDRVQSLEELDYVRRRYPTSVSSTEILNDTDREDSGIHTADVSCSVSQADEPVDEEVAHPGTSITVQVREPVQDDRDDGDNDDDEEDDEQVITECSQLKKSEQHEDEDSKPEISQEKSKEKVDSQLESAVIIEESIVIGSSFALESEQRSSESVEQEEEEEEEEEEEARASESTSSGNQSAELPLTCPNVEAANNAAPPVIVVDQDIYQDSQSESVASSTQLSYETESNISDYDKPTVVSPIAMEFIDTSMSLSKSIFPLNLSSDEEILNGLIFPLGPPSSVEPPKEKPPPPPTDLSDEENQPIEPLKRLNSTRRIKKELRTRRSDFLGIEGVNDDDLEFSLAKPPDMAAILAEERRIEQMHRRSYDTDSNYEQDSSHERDSGVELSHVEDWIKQPVSPDMSQHSRQSSEPFGASVTSSEEDEITKKEREIIEVLEKEEQWRYGNDREQNSDIGEKLAHKLRELEEEKMQLERERAQEVVLHRQDDSLRKNEEIQPRNSEEDHLRNQQQQQQQLILQQQEITMQSEVIRDEEMELREQEKLRFEVERLKLHEDIYDKERRNVDIRRQDDVHLRSIDRPTRQPEHTVVNAVMCDHDDEYSSGEVLRVERELLQLEQEALKRQRTNMVYREQKQQQLAEQLQEQWQSLQNVNYAGNIVHATYQNIDMANYRSSMPNLQLQDNQRRRPAPPPIPPAKPLRLIDQRQRDMTIRNSRIPSADSIPQQVDASLRHSTSAIALSTHAGQQMTKQTLNALSAVPRTRIVKNDQWVQRRKSDGPRIISQDLNYQHWLIQEAEQRRINEKNQRSPPQRKPQQHVTGTSVPYTATTTSYKSEGKPLPDSIIQTLTQRIQNRAQERPLPLRRRIDHSASQEHLPQAHHQPSAHLAMMHQKAHQSPGTSAGESQEKLLSVSGKKKCSHCGDELGRGAAMIIESLRLFYHMECFKCCVCHVRLGDGLMGTDVRVRNHKLHCHNCYSSDDGVKFSCV